MSNLTSVKIATDLCREYFVKNSRNGDNELLLTKEQAIYALEGVIKELKGEFDHVR